ncbi:MAG: hypothetical protein P4K86_08825 [Terracidiphilus sp.]|nr:hypothetical protein [Terracidiphilus sp.]
MKRSNNNSQNTCHQSASAGTGQVMDGEALASEFAQFTSECGAAIWKMKIAADAVSAEPLVFESPEHVIILDVMNICSAFYQAVEESPVAIATLCSAILSTLGFHKIFHGRINVEQAQVLLLEYTNSTVREPCAMGVLSTYDKADSTTKCNGMVRV